MLDCSSCDDKYNKLLKELELSRNRIKILEKNESWLDERLRDVEKNKSDTNKRLELIEAYYLRRQ